MVTETLFKDYREVIRQAFAERSQRNAAYSLRAFSRDLGITYSRLHDAIHGKKGLSVVSGRKIASNLDFTPSETEIFVTRIEAEHARSKLGKKNAREKLEKLALNSNHVVQEDVFRLIKDWYHFAIVELTCLQGFESSIPWISQRLNISEMETEQAVARLLDLGLLARDENGKLMASDGFTLTESALPSDAIRRNHEQMLDKAKRALHFQSNGDREFNNLTVSFNSKDMPAAKRAIREFLVDFERKFGRGDARDSIYAVAMQMIRLDEPQKEQV